MRIEGFVAPGFEPVHAAFAANFEAGEELGAGFAAVRDGEVLVNIWGGHADRAQTRPWARDTIVPVYSTTKGIAAIVVACCVEKGLINYEDRVAEVWPAFGAHGKDKLTLAEMLAHQAGVPGFVDPVDPALWLDPPACAQAIAALAPLWPPGSVSGYHPLTWGYLVGEIVSRIAERSLGAILREDICRPLGIDFQIGTPEIEHARCAEMKKPARGAEFGEITAPRRAAFFTPWAAPNRGAAEWRRVEIPAANGHGTALAVAQLYGFYATGGLIEGHQLISANVYRRLASRRFEGDDLVLPFNIDWRTGLMGNSRGVWGPNRETLGHAGMGGSCGFGDPVTRVSGGYVMNKQAPTLMGDPRAVRLIDALYTCL